jgi:hypothetical protein
MPSDREQLEEFPEPSRFTLCSPGLPCFAEAPSETEGQAEGCPCGQGFLSAQVIRTRNKGEMTRSNWRDLMGAG